MGMRSVKEAAADFACISDANCTFYMLVFFYSPFPEPEIDGIDHVKGFGYGATGYRLSP